VQLYPCTARKKCNDVLADFAEILAMEEQGFPVEDSFPGTVRKSPQEKLLSSKAVRLEIDDDRDNSE
jgi:hypothetical protein